MMNFMREGGISMWLMLATALGAFAFAATRTKPQRPAVLVTGCLAVMIESLLGLSTGMLMVSRVAPRLPDPTAAIAEGLGELSHNGTFGAALAALLGVGALIAASQAQAKE